MKTINVFIIDDSALIRQLLSDILLQDEAIASVESAPDPIFALRKMEKSWPDVIVLDIEMPRMNGIEFAKMIMKDHPTPIIIVSSQTERNARLSIEALNAGAFEIINKPESGLKDFLENSAQIFIDSVKAAASSGHRTRKRQFVPAPAEQKKIKPSVSTSSEFDRLVVLGASTGGTVAIEQVLETLTMAHAPIVIVQHMPSGFTRAFAERLDRLCPSHIKEAANGDILEKNSVYIAPGGMQCEIIQSADALKIKIFDGEPVNRHKPSVDTLFYSAAKVKNKKLLGIILTGMGADGAKGLLEIKNATGQTIAQDENTSVVFGMPAVAIQLGAAAAIKPLDEIGECILNFSDLSP